MRRAVDLDDEPCFVTREIGDVARERDLTAEAETFELLAAKGAPEKFFGRGRISAQSTCDGGEAVGHVAD
jgi:hypothetical protein